MAIGPLHIESRHQQELFLLQPKYSFILKSGKSSRMWFFPPRRLSLSTSFLLRLSPSRNHDSSILGRLNDRPKVPQGPCALPVLPLFLTISFLLLPSSHQPTVTLHSPGFNPHGSHFLSLVHSRSHSFTSLIGL